MSRLTKRNATLKASCKENSTYDCLLEDDCITCDCNNKILEKLAHYEDLEEAGRLIELPCKVGDTVYLVCGDGEGYDEGIVREIVVTRDAIEINSDYEIGTPLGANYLAFSKAEAERKLAELKGGTERE